MEELLVFTGGGGGGGDDDDFWKCRKHPSAQPTAGGVCPVCLRDRLLRLCPDCAGKTPCLCSCPSASSITSTSSSLSSVPSLDPPRRSAAGADVGAVGRVSLLIDCEPAFSRSRSAAFRLLRHRSEEAAGGGECVAPRRPVEDRRGWSWLWRFQKGKKDPDGEEGDKLAAAAVRLARSRSVGAAPGAYLDRGAVDGVEGRAGRGEARAKGWNRYFASPMKAFRHRKASKVMEARFPLGRGKVRCELHEVGEEKKKSQE